MSERLNEPIGLSRHPETLSGIFVHGPAFEYTDIDELDPNYSYLPGVTIDIFPIPQELESGDKQAILKTAIQDVDTVFIDTTGTADPEQALILLSEYASRPAGPLSKKEKKSLVKIFHDHPSTLESLAFALAQEEPVEVVSLFPGVPINEEDDLKLKSIYNTEIYEGKDFEAAMAYHLDIADLAARFKVSVTEKMADEILTKLMQEHVERGTSDHAQNPSYATAALIDPVNIPVINKLHDYGAIYGMHYSFHEPNETRFASPNVELISRIQDDQEIDELLLAHVVISNRIASYVQSVYSKTGASKTVNERKRTDLMRDTLDLTNWMTAHFTLAESREFYDDLSAEARSKWYIVGHHLLKKGFDLDEPGRLVRRFKTEKSKKMVTMSGESPDFEAEVLENESEYEDPQAETY